MKADVTSPDAKTPEIPKRSYVQSLSLAARLAIRELRAGLKGFYIFIACIALGVAAIAAVGSVTNSLLNAIEKQGQVLLGGDLTLSRVHQRATAQEKDAFKQSGQVSEIATFRTMARTLSGESQALVDLKTVDAAYPLFGQFKLQDGKQAKLKEGEVFVDPVLLEQLNVKSGERLRLGTEEVIIAGVIAHEPDRVASQAIFGARLMLLPETLEKTGLVQPGSLIRWTYLIKLHDPDVAIEAISETLSAKFRDAGFLVQNRKNPAPGVSSAVNRLGKFLVLVGLTALLIGGVGVANAVAAFVEQKRTTIATFKCLGANNGLIFTTYLFQVLLLAFLGVVIGLTVGTLLPLFLIKSYASLLPFELDITPQAGAMLAAAFYGLLVALIFVIWPLRQSRDVRPQMLFRDKISDEKPKFRWSDVMVISVLGSLLMAVAVLSSATRGIALYYCLGLLALFILFIGYGFIFMSLARKLPRFKTPEFILARSNLAGPASLAKTVILSLGLGLSLLVAIAVIDQSMLGQLRAGLPKQAPNFFFLDIRKDQLESFNAYVTKAAPGASLTEAPMLRGRIVSLNGTPSETIETTEEFAWILRGDRGITYSENVPENSTLVEGQWWEKNYNGPPLVSFEAESAKSFGLKIGDEIRVNIMGREISAKIANFRTVKWETLAMNFVVVFSPNTLAGAPVNVLATLKMENGQEVPQEGQFIQGLSKTFPNVTVLRVKDAIQSVSSIYEKIMLAIRVAGGLTLLAGALVLAGALSTAHRRRIYEAVLFKTLGATRRRIVLSHMLEYATLALVTAILAIVLGVAAAFVITKFIFEISISFSTFSILQAVVFALILVMISGCVGSWRALSMKTSLLLRAE